MSEYIVQLHEPFKSSPISIEGALRKRRSVREYRNVPLGLHDLGQLLWAGQGVTDEETGYRTAPSAGALYPLELHVVATDIHGVIPGVYKYRPSTHELVQVSVGQAVMGLYKAALEQPMIKEAAAVIAISAVYDKMYIKYGTRSGRYLYFEAGCAAENIALQAIPLGLGVVNIGAFDDEEVKKVLALQEKEFPLCLIPIGWPK
jgi:SagB-type dehydrogenase family enzyme